MRPAPVQSFGRRVEPQEQVAGPAALPPIQLPVVLIVDAGSLALAAEQITEMVTRAVRAGIVRAVEEIETAPDAASLDEPEPFVDQMDPLGR
jgi:hypothetical protein